MYTETEEQILLLLPMMISGSCIQPCSGTHPHPLTHGSPLQPTACPACGLETQSPCSKGGASSGELIGAPPHLSCASLCPLCPLCPSNSIHLILPPRKPGNLKPLLSSIHGPSLSHPLHPPLAWPTKPQTPGNSSRNRKKERKRTF